MPVATRVMPSNWLSASITPKTTIVAVISRRTSRRRVAATGDSGPDTALAIRPARLTR